MLNVTKNGRKNGYMKRNVGMFCRDTYRQLELMFLMDRPRFDADPESTLYY